LDRLGDVYVTGQFQTKAVFGPGEDKQTTLLANGKTENFDGFLAKLGGICGDDELDCILARIQELYVFGVINKGQANSLANKIERAKQRLEEGNDRAAVRMLNVFIRQVEAFMEAGIIPTDEGEQLIYLANLVIDQINGN
jgi:hypothetical protein